MTAFNRHIHERLCKLAGLLGILLLSTPLIRPAYSADLLVGDRAYNFTLKSESGENLNLKEHRGYVILVTFWASWCTHCLRQLEALTPLYDQYEQDGFKIWAIGVDPDQQQARLSAKMLHLPYTLMFDPENHVMRRYHVRDIPTTLLIDRDGIVRARFEAQDKDMTQEYQRQLLAILK